MNKFECYLDSVSSNTLYGWAIDHKNMNDAIEIEILENGVLLGSIVANKYRVDVFKANIGTGYYGFEFVLPYDFTQKGELIFDIKEIKSKDSIWYGSRVFENKGNGNFIESEKLTYYKKKTIIFLTTPTSATGSMWRILAHLSQGKYKTNRFVDNFFIENRIEDLKIEILPTEGEIILFNAPDCFNESLDINDYKFILNVRDPRDMLCNQYHWQFQHPFPYLSEEELSKMREQCALEGIDSWVCKEDVNRLFQPFYKILKEARRDQVIIASYALLCHEFDAFVQLVSDFLEVTPNQRQLGKINLERVNNLKKNPDWIGNQWTGADAVMPGRFLNELKPETATFLTKRYEQIITWLAENDHHSVRDIYMGRKIDASEA